MGLLSEWQGRAQVEGSGDGWAGGKSCETECMTAEGCSATVPALLVFRAKAFLAECRHAARPGAILLALAILVLIANQCIPGRIVEPPKARTTR
jgi:hypothetical protein